MVWVQAVFDPRASAQRRPLAASESPIAYGKRLDALRFCCPGAYSLCEALSLVCYGRNCSGAEEIDMVCQGHTAHFRHPLPWWQVRS